MQSVASGKVITAAEQSRPFQAIIVPSIGNIQLSWWDPSRIHPEAGTRYTRRPFRRKCVWRSGSFYTFRARWIIRVIKKLNTDTLHWPGHTRDSKSSSAWKASALLSFVIQLIQAIAQSRLCSLNTRLALIRLFSFEIEGIDRFQCKHLCIGGDVKISVCVKVCQSVSVSSSDII